MLRRPSSMRCAAIGALAAACALPAASMAAEAMTNFSETGGCMVRSSETSAVRMREVASQGSVAWDGKCRNGFIDGPGVLRHQGEVVENGRTRRYAFYLTGTARDGLRTGQWRRETFNMFADSMRYWTSLATIQYADGISRGAPKLLEVRGNADFSPAFREFLSAVDRELAARERPAGASGTIGRVDGTQGLAVAPENSLRPESELSPLAPPRPPAVAGPTAAAATTPAPVTSNPAPVAAAAAPSTVPATVPSQAPAPPRVTSPAAPPAAEAIAAPKPSAAPAMPPAAPPALPPVPTAVPPASETAPQPAQIAAAPPAAAAAVPPPAAEPVPERNMPAFSGGLKPRVAGIGLSPLETPKPAPPPRPPRILEQLAGCNLDTVNGKPVGIDPIRLPRGSALRVAGWAADPRFKNVPPQAWLHMSSTQVTDSITIEMARNTERPDVAKALGAQVYAKSGFDLPLEARQLPAGDYTVSIIQLVAGELLVCKSMARVSLR